jgi:CHAD domain-containing protein
MTGMALGPSGKWIAAIGPDCSVCEAVRRSLEARLATVAHYLPLAAYHAAQDIEHVHRLRVGTRRAMAVLQLYQEYLARKPARWVKKRLKKVRRAAGEARDLDVLADRLQREHGDRAAKVIEKIITERAVLQPPIVRVCERFRRKDKFVRQAARLIDNVRCPDACDSAGDASNFREWATRQLSERAAVFLSSMPDAQADLADLHKFRVRGKQFRYSFELLAPGLPTEVRDTHYPTIEKLQECLGNINDHATARDRLREWATETSDAELADALCSIAEDEVARLTAALGGWREWWTPERVNQLREGLQQGAAHRLPRAGEVQGENSTEGELE